MAAWTISYLFGQNSSGSYTYAAVEFSESGKPSVYQSDSCQDRLCDVFKCGKYHKQHKDFEYESKSTETNLGVLESRRE